MLMHHSKTHAKKAGATHAHKKKTTTHKKKKTTAKKAHGHAHTVHKAAHGHKKHAAHKAGHAHKKHAATKTVHKCTCGGKKRRHSGKKRGMTAFLAYMQMRRNALIKENPNRPFGAYAKIAGKEWKEMAPEEKAAMGKKALAWYKSHKKSRGKK
ncbi:hypothetical protein [Sicyoidochytrium minutum DNA virus]|nr:hypothetical protein [Sicyoidochytrium minutum DNA virus]